MPERLVRHLRERGLLNFRTLDIDFNVKIQSFGRGLRLLKDAESGCHAIFLVSLALFEWCDNDRATRRLVVAQLECPSVRRNANWSNA